MAKTKAEHAKKYRNDSLFGGNREKAIQRDGERCVKCGMTRAEHRAKYGYDITVDHIDGNGVSKPREAKNNDLSNLQTLCSGCHGKKDAYRRKGPFGWTCVKLTHTQVINIYHVRSIKGASMSLARAYGVDKSSAWLINNGYAWSTLTGEKKQVQRNR